MDKHCQVTIQGIRLSIPYRILTESEEPEFWNDISFQFPTGFSQNNNDRNIKNNNNFQFPTGFSRKA